MRVTTAILISFAGISMTAALGLLITWFRKPRWMKRWHHVLGVGVTLALATVAASIGLLADSEPGPQLASPKEAPGRTLQAWATDINAICADHAEEQQAAIVQTRTTGREVVQLSQNTLRSGETGDYLEELDVLVGDAFDAAAMVDAVYTTILRKGKSVELPEDEEGQTAAESWLAGYEGLADEFADYYQSLANYLQSTNSIMKSIFLGQMTLELDAYNQMAIEVADEGAAVGVESC